MTEIGAASKLLKFGAHFGTDIAQDLLRTAAQIRTVRVVIFIVIHILIGFDAHAVKILTGFIHGQAKGSHVGGRF